MIAAVAIVADHTEMEVDTLARTLWGEARGEGEAGMIAVAAVIRNRIDLSARLGGRHWWGMDWISVCRARGQFSSWNPGDPNRVKLLAVKDSDPDFRLAKRIAADAIAGRIDDPTFGATAYRVADQPWPYSWGHFRLPLTEIGRHAFYNFAKEPVSMDPISIAFGLAQFVPAITRWLGGDQAGDIAQQVVGAAETLTGKTGPDALDAIKADPAQQLAFRQAMAAKAGDLEKAYLSDRAAARAHDLALSQPGRRNLRADVLAYAAIGGLISLIWALLVRQIPEGSTRDILLILSGALVAIVKDVYGFEFGSSRGSEVKTEQLGRMIGEGAAKSG